MPFSYNIIVQSRERRLYKRCCADIFNLFNQCTLQLKFMNCLQRWNTFLPLVSMTIILRLLQINRISIVYDTNTLPLRLGKSLRNDCLRIKFWLLWLDNVFLKTMVIHVFLSKIIFGVWHRAATSDSSLPLDGKIFPLIIVWKLTQKHGYRILANVIIQVSCTTSPV